MDECLYRWMADLPATSQAILLEDRCSFLITLSAVTEIAGGSPGGDRLLKIFTFWSDLLQCLGLFVANAERNRRKGIVVRLALRAR